MDSPPTLEAAAGEVPEPQREVHGRQPAPSCSLRRSIRVVLVDDHDLVRTGLARILEADPGLEVAGEAQDVRGLWKLIQSGHPDVVVLDLRLPGEDGAEAALRLVREYPELGLLILSSRANPCEVQRLVEAGVRGYVTKSASARELLTGVHRVAGGGYYYSPDAAAALAASVRSAQGPAGGLLTLRHLQVLERIAEGKTTRQAAEELCLSPKTVEKYRGAILARLGVRNQLEAVARARSLGLLAD